LTNIVGPGKVLLMTNNTLAGFKVQPNGYDVRIECNRCGASKAGSLARTWAGSHECKPKVDKDQEAK
jgi:hypothetical protein